MPVNPTREASVISAPRKSPARALTWHEEGALFAALRNDEIAAQLDLVDLVEFLAGTWAENGTIEERTKTSAGWRVIAAPQNVMALLSRRIDDP